MTFSLDYSTCKDDIVCYFSCFCYVSQFLHQEISDIFLWKMSKSSHSSRFKDYFQHFFYGSKESILNSEVHL